jgi:hypothetical protein
VQTRLHCGEYFAVCSIAVDSGIFRLRRSLCAINRYLMFVLVSFVYILLY